MNEKQGSARSQKAVLQMPAQLKDQFKQLTDAAVLSDDLQKAENFKSILMSLSDEGLPDEVSGASDNGSSGFLDSLNDAGDDNGVSAPSVLPAIEGHPVGVFSISDADSTSRVDHPADLSEDMSVDLLGGDREKVLAENPHDEFSDDGGVSFGIIGNEDGLPEDEDAKRNSGFSFGGMDTQEGDPFLEGPETSPNPESDLLASPTVAPIAIVPVTVPVIDSNENLFADELGSPANDTLSSAFSEDMFADPEGISPPSLNDDIFADQNDTSPAPSDVDLEAMFSQPADEGASTPVDPASENSFGGIFDDEGSEGRNATGNLDDIFADDGADVVQQNDIAWGLPVEESDDTKVLPEDASTPQRADEDSVWTLGDLVTPVAAADPVPLGIGDQAFSGAAPAPSRFMRPKPVVSPDVDMFEEKEEGGSGLGSSLPEPSPFGNAMSIPGYETVPGEDEDHSDDDYPDHEPVVFGVSGDAGVVPDLAVSEKPRETSSANISQILDLTEDEATDQHEDSKNEAEGVLVMDAVKQGEKPKGKKFSLMNLSPFGKNRKPRSEDDDEDDANVNVELSPGERIVMTTETDEKTVERTAEVTEKGDVKTSKVVKTKKSNMPVFLGGLAAALVAAFVLDATQIIDIPFIGGQTAPVIAKNTDPAPGETFGNPDPEDVATAPVQGSETFGVPDLPVGGPSITPPGETPAVDVAALPTEEPQGQAETESSDQPDPFLTDSDRAVNADPAMLDMFDVGTTVTISENPNAGPDENIVRIVDEIEDQKVQVSGALAQIDEINRAILERDEAMVQRDEAIQAALEIAQRAESIALAQNEILVRMVETEETLKRSGEVLQNLSERVAVVETNDTVYVEVDRMANELQEQKRDIESLARSMIANNAALEQRKREIDAQAALAAQRPAPPPSLPVPSGAGVVYGTGGDVVLELPGANAPAPVVPADAKRGDVIVGYGTIEEISPVEGGERLIITENGSFVVQ